MIKEVFCTFGVVVSEIEENEGSYILKNPLTFMVQPEQQGLAFSFAPLSLINPLIDLTVPKDSVYAIADINPELVKGYQEFVTQLKAAASGIEVATDTNSSNIKKLIN